MAVANLRREERIGLGVAIALHLAIVVAFLIQPGHRDDLQPTQRMTVSLVNEVGLNASAPQPVPESRAAIAPELSNDAVPAPPVEPQPVNQPPVQPRSEQRPRPPVSKPTPKPASATQKRGGSLLGDNFLSGLGSSSKTNETRAPASQIGASAKASLVQAIARQLKPHWTPPDGPDVDRITTYLRFRLNPDGSLAGRPQLVRQTGVTPLNRAQAGRHAEQAIRAVELAAPFDLPEQYYDAWKNVSSFGFDWKLAQ